VHIKINTHQTGKDAYTECTSNNEQCPMNQLLQQIFNKAEYKLKYLQQMYIIFTYKTLTFCATGDFIYFFFFPAPQAVLYCNPLWWICQIKQMFNIININTLHNFFFQLHCSWHYTGYVKHVILTNKQTNKKLLSSFLD
jgi:hypothetical protein